MIKYFISSQKLDIIKSEEYCMSGFVQNDRCLIEQIKLCSECSHNSCLGVIVKQENKVITLKEIVPDQDIFNPAGDRSHRNKLLYQSLIIDYNEKSFYSILPYVNEEFLQEIGSDFKFLVDYYSNLNLTERKVEIPVTDPVLKCEATRNTSISSRICNFSFTYRYLKYRKEMLATKDLNEIISTVFLEAILALIVALVINYNFSNYLTSEIIESNFLYSLDSTVNMIDELITWLMGIPVGLKLNRPLSRVLGRFYLFHLSIWKQYMISVVMPIVVFIISQLYCLIPLGLSLILCLLLDILSFTTVHLSCFYVYACRLYRLLFVIIISLFRIFQGKKWNPLRCRIDHASLDIDRLFACTLMLTCCIFLLPTCIIYYLVFTTIELVIVFIQHFICYFIGIAINWPIFNIITWCYNHPKHNKKINIEKICESDSCMLMRVEFCKISFSQLFPYDDEKFHIVNKIVISNFIIHILKGLNLE